ncbi:MAG: sensor histidine kinase [Flavobacteriales bacterium]|nr:sensor histidine kinase [Flavobacteriales bacterium]
MLSYMHFSNAGHSSRVYLDDQRLIQPKGSFILGQLSPRQLALLIAFIVAILAASLSALGTFGIIPNSEVWWPFAVAVFVFAVAYGAVSFGIEQFIHRRIKMLYRTVHDLKRNPKEMDHLNLKGDVLGQVNEEVRAWARERGDQIEELEEREKFRREFIGNLAHELKTPIHNIQGYILTLLEGGLEDDRVNRDFLERAFTGVDRLNKLVEDLDMITKLESGVMDLRTAPLNLNELVQETKKGMEILSKERGVKLKNTVPQDLMVLADRDRLAQVFTNLFNNAVNYGKPNGTCTVRAYTMGDQVAVELSDDGIGISKQHLPRLFERFYRVGKSRARNEGGSGLGLAIVKHIIEAHDQTIAVKSNEGEGTTFVFTLEKAS